MFLLWSSEKHGEVYCITSFEGAVFDFDKNGEKKNFALNSSEFQNTIWGNSGNIKVNL